MQPLTLDQWQWLWDQAKKDNAVRDWLFQILVEPRLQCFRRGGDQDYVADLGTISTIRGRMSVTR
jgi:hypothetical protein